MIAADTSTWIAFFGGRSGEDVELLDRALGDRQVVLPPPVLAELVSDPRLPAETSRLLAELPMPETTDGYWLRAGKLRSRVVARGRKARLADALIAQCCLDHGLLLITRDRDFRAFAALAGLELAVPATPRR